MWKIKSCMEVMVKAPRPAAPLTAIVCRASTTKGKKEDKGELSIFHPPNKHNIVVYIKSVILRVPLRCGALAAGVGSFRKSFF